MNISVASISDTVEITELYHSAFDASEAHGVCQVALDILALDNTDNAQHISLVSRQNNRIVGHIAFTKLGAECDEVGYILAPLAVTSSMQHRGIGSALVQAGINILKALHTDFVLVYGDPMYYSRFGFEVITTLGTPFPLSYPQGYKY